MNYLRPWAKLPGILVDAAGMWRGNPAPNERLTNGTTFFTIDICDVYDGKPAKKLPHVIRCVVDECYDDLMDFHYLAYRHPRRKK